LSSILRDRFGLNKFLHHFLVLRLPALATGLQRKRQIVLLQFLLLYSLCIKLLQLLFPF